VAPAVGKLSSIVPDYTAVRFVRVPASHAPAFGDWLSTFGDVTNCVVDTSAVQAASFAAWVRFAAAPAAEVTWRGFFVGVVCGFVGGFFGFFVWFVCVFCFLFFVVVFWCVCVCMGSFLLGSLKILRPSGMCSGSASGHACRHY
jgi:hypothetical protein